MKANEIMKELFRLANERDYSNTCDTLKAGNPDTETDKVAVSMFATPDVVRQATKSGAQLLIVHEPITIIWMSIRTRKSSAPSENSLKIPA